MLSLGEGLGETVKAFRASVIIVILFNLALLAAATPLRSMLVRYELAREQQDLRALQLEHRSLYHQAALARRPDVVLARAATMGIDVHLVDQEDIASAAGLAPVARRPLLANGQSR
jgi:hypothetical protein